jgi:hypothetical protein
VKGWLRKSISSGNAGQRMACPVQSIHNNR